jgi:tetratricopeptide (TPR) repeat protein
MLPFDSTTLVLPLLLLMLAPAAAQDRVPPLPQLALDTYPVTARDVIARAHQDAAAHDTDAQAVGTLGRVLHAWEQWNAAHTAYTRAAALAPRTFDWPYLDAVVLQRLARPSDAVGRLETALSIAPDNLPARLRLAEASLDAGDLEKSGRLFAALTDPACEPAVQFGLGRIAAAQGQQAEAVTHFQRAIALFPAFGSAHYALARSYRALGRTEDARAEMEAHARDGARWPALPDPVLATVTSLREDAGALLQRGVKLADAGDVDGAIAAHERAVAIDPSLAQAHANLISLYGRTHNWSKAEEHYKAVVALGVNVAEAQYDYGVLLGMQQRWDEAADAYRKALALNPLHAQAHNNLGQILERGRKFEEAMGEYRLAVESQPTLRIARFNLGRMLIALGKPDEALAELQTLTEPRDAEAPKYLFALSVAHARVGHKDQALTWATEARQLALKFGDTDLAAAIDRSLGSLK